MTANEATGQLRDSEGKEETEGLLGSLIRILIEFAFELF